MEMPQKATCLRHANPSLLRRIAGTWAWTDTCQLGICVISEDELSKWVKRGGERVRHIFLKVRNEQRNESGLRTGWRCFLWPVKSGVWSACCCSHLLPHSAHVLRDATGRLAGKWQVLLQADCSGQPWPPLPAEPTRTTLLTQRPRCWPGLSGATSLRSAKVLQKWRNCLWL